MWWEIPSHSLIPPLCEVLQSLKKLSCAFIALWYQQIWSSQTECHQGEPPAPPSNGGSPRIALSSLLWCPHPHPESNESWGRGGGHIHKVFYALSQKGWFTVVQNIDAWWVFCHKMASVLRPGGSCRLVMVEESFLLTTVKCSGCEKIAI